MNHLYTQIDHTIKIDFKQRNKPAISYQDANLYVKHLIHYLHVWDNTSDADSAKIKKMKWFASAFFKLHHSAIKYNQSIYKHGQQHTIDGYDNDTVYAYFKKSVFNAYQYFYISKILVWVYLLKSSLNLNIKRGVIVLVRTGQIINIPLPKKFVDIQRQYLLILDDIKMFNNIHINHSQLGVCLGKHQSLLKHLVSNIPVQVYIQNKKDLDKYEKCIKEKLNHSVYIHSPNYLNLSDFKGYQLILIRKMLDFAAEYKFNGVVIHVGKGGNSEIKIGGTNENDAITYMRSNLVDCVKYSESKLLLLETPAGQGKELLITPEQFGKFYNTIPIEYRKNIGVCVDTCHVFAAGYLPDKYITLLSHIIGRENIKLIHFNDSVYPRFSRRDRHAVVGEGYIPRSSLCRVIEWAKKNKVDMIREY